MTERMNASSLKLTSCRGCPTALPRLESRASAKAVKAEPPPLGHTASPPVLQWYPASHARPPLFKTYLPDTTGGIEQVIFQLSEGGRNLGIESQVLALSPDAQPACVQVENHHVRRAHQDVFIASTGFSREAFGLFREMASEADLVHFHFPWPVMDLVHFLSRHGKPSIVSYHSDIVRQRALLSLYRPLMLRFLASVDRILVASPNYQHSSDVLVRFTDKTEIIPYGLDKAAYPSQPRKTYSLASTLQVPFFIRRVLRHYKGLSFTRLASGDAVVGRYSWLRPEEANLKIKLSGSALPT